jgi:hypothetical protein
MRRFPAFFRRRRVSGATLVFAAAFWSACSGPQDAPAGPDLQPSQAILTPVQEVDLGPAIAAQARNSARLMAIPGVVGNAVGVREGQPTILVYTQQAGTSGIPDQVEGFATRTVVSGMVVAWTDETGKHRPSPLGMSIGHPDITAGTLGFKVKDSSGNPFILSNNHVMANINQASIGDHILQPGAYDGGTDPADRIGDLAAFVPIDFSLNGSNVVDAAIASVLDSDVLSSTPLDEGYGQPSSTTVPAYVGMPVQKYGRTTEETHGTVDAVNGAFSVCYEPVGPFCLTAANFVNQIVIIPGTFSAGGDSGSGIVSDDANLNPVGLLFAGSTSFTIANPIDAVLASFNVSVDDGGGEPPPELTDIRISSVSAPASVAGGEVVPVPVTVFNSGNQDVGTNFNVTLRDVTDGGEIGSQQLPGLSAGATAVVDFTWDTDGVSFGDHVLEASHDFADDQPGNDAASTTVEVRDPSAPWGVHVGDIDVVDLTNNGSSWNVTVEVAIHDATHALVDSATIVGEWDPFGLFATDTCTTGDLGGDGTCIFVSLYNLPDVLSETFTVTSVTLAGQPYQPGDNHDPDGDSDGTTITVLSPITPNNPPTADDVAASGDEDGGPIPWTPSVSDADGDPLTCSIASQPANGSASLSPDCSAGTYTPDADFNGLDPFTYSVSDGSASDQGTVTVTVNAVNDAPMATGEAYAATVGTDLTVSAPGVLGNDGDVDGDVLTAQLGTGPSHASSFNLALDGSFTYTSDGTTGTDSFTYQASDGSLASSFVTVNITVSEAPVGVTITAIDPTEAPVSSVVDVTITGSGFAAGASVSFENGSGPAPQISNVEVVDGSTIHATVTIKNGGPRRNREWDVRVTNTDGSTGVLSGEFTVMP